MCIRARVCMCVLTCVYTHTAFLEDLEANVVYYCLHKLHKWPHEFLSLPRREQAYVIAAVEMKIEQDKQEAAKIKSAAKK